MKPDRPQTWRPRPLRLAAPVGLALLALALGGASLVSAVQCPSVCVTVTGPGGLGDPLPAGLTLVKLLDMNGETVRGQAVVSATTPSAVFASLPNGQYLVRAEPPPGAPNLTPSEPRRVDVLAGVLPPPVITLALTTPQYPGTVTEPDGVTPVTGTVLVRAGDRFFQRLAAPQGQFALGGLPPGVYTVRAFRATVDPFYDSPAFILEVPTLTVGSPITLTLTPAQLYGTVRDNLSQPVDKANVMAGRPGLTLANVAGPQGYWAIGGLPQSGQLLLRAFPPVERPALQPSAPQTVTVTSLSNPYDLSLLYADKAVSGTVRTNTGTPVAGALVEAKRLDAPGAAQIVTDPQGAYRLSLSPGLWSLTVRHTPQAAPADWVYAQPPQMAQFRFDQNPEGFTVNFTVRTADAGVTGVVQMPSVIQGGGLPFTVTVHIVNDEGAGRQVTADPATGAFSATVPNGLYRVVVTPQDPGYLGPVVPPVTVPPTTTVAVGTLELLARNSAITGTVRDAGGSPVAGLPVSAWRPGAPGAITELTGPDGAYVLSVAAGIWQVQPHPKPDQPYLFRGQPVSQTVAATTVISNVDFSLLTADAAVQGVVVDEAGRILGAAAGYVHAQNVVTPALSVGAPLQAGQFLLRVAPNYDYRVVARLPAGADFLSSPEVTVTALSGVTQTITLTVRAKTPNTAIAGAVVNARTGAVVAGVAGDVAAWSGNDWAAARVAPNGAYRLDVAAGLWRLDYRIDPALYAKVAGARSVPVQAGQVAQVNLPVLAKDGVLTGTVLAADGLTPLAGVRVAAHGLLPPVRDQWFTAVTDNAGRFRISLPSGRYRVGAGTREDAVWPVEREVSVPPGGSASVTLQFRTADATLSGTLTLSDSTASGPALVWAWSEDGGLAKGTATLTNGAGAYSLNVVAGATWQVRAVFGTATQVWFGAGSAAVSGATTLDVTLAGPRPRPGPVVVTFDAAEAQSLTLSDGTDIYVPAGALPATGQVTLRVEPIVTLTGHRGADVFRYGYAFLAADANGQPITANFNQDVVIRFGYDEAELARLGLREERLRPAYYSTTARAWSYPEAYVVDTAANVVTMQVDHFTDFALTGQAATYDLYLPTVNRP